MIIPIIVSALIVEFLQVVHADSELSADIKSNNTALLMLKSTILAIKKVNILRRLQNTQEIP